MTDSVYASYPVFKVVRASDPAPKDVVLKELEGVFEEYVGRVTPRGLYDTTGFTAKADTVFWLVSSSLDDLQSFLNALKKTAFGARTDPADAFVGLVRPAEFAKDHQPAFVKGEEPKRYFTVYPFVRTPEWYLLPPDERGGLLREHGMAGREFPDVLANTTSAFALGDYEWILAFEADSPDRLVDLIRRLRATEARRFTKLETPFYTGIRKELPELVEDLF